jgi:IS5 family transposase
VLRGDTLHPHKLLSVFETHTEGIRKGKAVKPTEFGTMLKVQEAEAQFITDYQVCAVPDGELWESSLERHEQLFGGPPQLATADAGFTSAAKKRAEERGVHRVALPRRGRLSEGRRAHQLTTRPWLSLGSPPSPIFAPSSTVQGWMPNLLW